MWSQTAFVVAWKEVRDLRAAHEKETRNVRYLKKWISFDEGITRHEA